MKTIRIASCLIAASLIMADAQPVMSAPAPVPQTTQQKNGKGKKKKSASGTTKKTSGTNKNNSGTKNNTGTKKGAGTKKKSKGSKKQTSARKETSADVSRQHEATQREITETKQQLKLNEANIKKGVEELGRLQGDIKDSKEKVEEAGKVVSGLDSRISGLESQVEAQEAQLQKLRAEYLKAVKKMRIAGKGNSTLAFLFSSGTFNEALRRMRYLKQFSQWKERQSSEITKKVNALKADRDALEKTRREKETALRKQQNAHKELQGQYARQDAIVVELRANGEALNAHLAKKQAEANTLKSRISSLIAAEEATRREQEAAARREAEARERKEREAAEAREREERAREKEAQRQAEEAAAKAAQNKTEPTKTEKTNEVKKTTTKASDLVKQEKEQKAASRKQSNKDKKKTESAKKQDVPPVQKAETASSNSKKGGDYADARRRKPRSESGKKETPKQASTPSGDGSFEKMRGSLPKPVSGSFKVTSPFGRHALPELPDVVYDNPGIDAQVSSGASAQAVYAGRVSGVYVIPGYSTVVIVNHGNYYTVYGNIESPSVKVGDNVKQGQGLGKLAVDDDDKGHSSIHFEVWKNREKLNPADWIRY